MCVHITLLLETAPKRLLSNSAACAQHCTQAVDSFNDFRTRLFQNGLGVTCDELLLSLQIMVTAPLFSQSATQIKGI